MDDKTYQQFESGLVCLALAGRLHKRAVNIDELRRNFTDPKLREPKFVNIQIIRAAKSLGFRAKFKTTPVSVLNQKIFPVIAKHVKGHFVLIVNCSDKGLLVQDVTANRPAQLVSRESFYESYEQQLLMLTPRQGLLTQAARFGFKWFLPVMAKYKRFFTDVLIASFFIQLLALASPIFFQVAIDKVMVHKGMTTLDVLAIGFLFVIIFEVILSGLRGYLFSHTTNRVDVELGSLLYDHMLKLPIAFFKSRRVGDTVARLKELDTIRDFMTGSALTVVLDMLFTLVFFAVMFYYAPVLTWIVVGSLPFYFAIALILGPKLRHNLEQKFQRSAENHSFLVESVYGIETVKSLAIEPQMRSKWEDKLADYVGVSFKAGQLNNIYGQCSSFITKLTGLLILYFGAIAVTDGDLSIGQFIAFNLLAQRVTAPIMRFANLWQDFQQAKISVERLGDILNSPVESGEKNKLSLPQLNGSVRFEHVSFSYSPERPNVLSDINLEINAGEVIGIVGRSGSGKSSLTKLVQRLYLVSSGRVLVDNVDLSLINPSWLRQKVGVVLQENFLFNASVRDNIALSDPSASLGRVIKAAKLAGAHDFILELPHAYDTEVGEQGANLSGGQKQRIAIARALLTDPSILIFDEATSALDYESERIIQQNMQQISQGRTVFIIAHRLSAVQHADRIVVLDRGRIVEKGTHIELLASQGHYHYLYQLQFGETKLKRQPV
ncbi:type I secretion system permease/ATPase [Pseudoalteromonas sp. S16_S37]|uniref:type I secretion system permease/ATPase n=1 Tax=Pseudoalteromonas sp. S16_S37 TaxID=2720228 RepID=UPI0016803AF4|nr:type I secretion system permease/ATPase [Pseudoalteromonas sp. S16_S37]MBD1583404.1 type I secretion system permease/ATPase [Pseudoalteromonas sp. S16_S37]